VWLVRKVGNKTWSMCGAIMSGTVACAVHAMHRALIFFTNRELLTLLDSRPKAVEVPRAVPYAPTPIERTRSANLIRMAPCEVDFPIPLVAHIWKWYCNRGYSERVSFAKT
jgi:hypothetical protein